MRRVSTLSAVIMMIVAFLIVRFAEAAAQTTISQPTTFYLNGSAGASGSNVAGCGTAPSNACATCGFLYQQLQLNYEIEPGGFILIKISGNSHADGCQLAGRMPGQAFPRQIEIIGSMTSPTSYEMSNPSGDVISASNGAMFAVGGMMLQHNASGQGVVTVGYGGNIQLLGEIVSLGDASSNHAEFNDLSAANGGLIEFQTPDSAPDPLGIKADGNYTFDGPGQCAFDAGNGGVIQANGNGQPNFFTFNWNNQTYTLATGCANALGLVQIQNITHVGSVSAAEQHVVTCGVIDTAGTGLPHSTTTNTSEPCQGFN
jgi:hypothetical protein